MKVLIIGANGSLGPHVAQALEGRHHLRLTDVEPKSTRLPTNTDRSMSDR